MAAIIVPIHTTTEEQVPVGNCRYTVKIDSRTWSCLDEEQYKQYQTEKQQKREADNIKLEQYHFDAFFVATIILCVAIPVYLGAKERDGAVFFFSLLISILLGFCAIIAFIGIVTDFIA